MFRELNGTGIGPELRCTMTVVGLLMLMLFDGFSRCGGRWIEGGVPARYLVSISV